MENFKNLNNEVCTEKTVTPIQKQIIIYRKELDAIKSDILKAKKKYLRLNKLIKETDFEEVINDKYRSLHKAIESLDNKFLSLSEKFRQIREEI